MIFNPFPGKINGGIRKRMPPLIFILFGLLRATYFKMYLR